MTTLTLAMNTGESIRLDLDTPKGICACCQHEPRGPFLDVSIGSPGPDAYELYSLTICRDCLAEYAPEGLALVEDE
jgi:hypothetical protein